MLPSPSEGFLHTLSQGDVRQTVCQQEELSDGQGAQVRGDIV
jgi:hypothetical protein